MACEMPADVAEIVMGQSPPGEAVARESVWLPLLNGPTEFGPHHPVPVQFTTDARKGAQKGDILFCVRGSTPGRMNWADQDYAIGHGVAAIRHVRASDLQRRSINDDHYSSAFYDSQRSNLRVLRQL